MKIAICCEKEDSEGLVAADFRNSPFLLMIDVEQNVIYHVYGKQDPENLVFARKIAEEDCEAVICGPIDREPFEILAKAGVSRYDGAGRKAQRAFVRFLRNQLPLIREYTGGPGPAGHRHGLQEEEAGTFREDLTPGEAVTGNLSGRKNSADPGTLQPPEREDTLFFLSEEEAAGLPDEVEIPDHMSREEVEELLASMAGNRRGQLPDRKRPESGLCGSADEAAGTAKE